MWKLSRRRRGVMALVLSTILWMHLPGAPISPTPALAAPNADPDEEIVYIDANGVIRVLDTRVTGSNPEVRWFSPDAGWRDLTLVDVNNDGDMEIVAIGGGSTDGKLAVFDPVVASGAINPDQKINEIPWDTLYRVDVPGTPRLIANGEFDQNVPGREIIYTYDLRPEDRENSNDRTRAVVLKADSPTPTGRGWQEHLTMTFSESWQQIAVGNLDGRTTDEIAFVSEDDANMKVYRIDGGPRQIHEYGSNSRAPKAIAIGRWDGNDSNERLAWSRDASPPLGAVFVQRWEGDKDFDDVYGEAFDPSPRILFFAQINANDEAELVMLRNVPNNGSAARMIVRGDNSRDIPSELEQQLDRDNGYRSGAAGDVDGDGFDEIVLIREDRILVFYEPDRSNRSNTYELSTNRSTIQIGNLDAIGFISGPQFGSDRSQIDGIVEAGGQQRTEVFTLINTTSSDAVPFSINVVGSPSWLTVTPVAGVTPAQIFLTFNSLNVQAGDYRTQLQIFSSDSSVLNQPFTIEVTLKVTAALVSVQPPSLGFSHACTDTVSIPTRTINVGGTPNIRYTAAIVDSPDFAAAQETLASSIYNGYIDNDGTLILRDEQGNEVALPLNGKLSNGLATASATNVEWPLGILRDEQGNEVASPLNGELSSDLAAASATNVEWPSGVPWLSARSSSGFIPDTITLQASSLYSETVRYDEALLVLVADSRAGAPPGNVRVVPVSNLCATDTIYLSLIGR